MKHNREIMFAARRRRRLLREAQRERDLATHFSQTADAYEREFGEGNSISQHWRDRAAERQIAADKYEAEAAEIEGG